MGVDYLSIQIKEEQAAHIVQELYNIKGEVTALPGEIDFNFRIKNKNESYLLKISRPDANEDYIDFQHKIIDFVYQSETQINSPKTIADINGHFISKWWDADGNDRSVRLLSWMDGRLWSSVNPQKENLLFSLGSQAALLSNALRKFNHPLGKRKFEWDIAQVEWTFDYIDHFDKDQQKIVKYFQERFQNIQNPYKCLRKSIIHNDINDNNIVVSDDLIYPEVTAIIDYGDAIHTQTINDLAVIIAYAVMNKADALAASLPVIKGYHKDFPLLEEELELLYTLVAMRLVISITKSAINKKQEPDNSYLLISEKPAWDVLNKWMKINENFAHFSFRNACGFTPHPNEESFKKWTNTHSFSLSNLFPSSDFNGVHPLDMSIESKWLGHEIEYNDNDILAFKLSRLELEYPKSLLAGGYMETRPLYCTDAYKKESNNGAEYRSIHLGIDFWLPAQTPVHALFEGEVVTSTNDAGDKEYGGLIILKHQFDHSFFYSLYGHQSVESIEKLKIGDWISKGDQISQLGSPNENGNWCSHLHFQIILDTLGNKNDFPGVAFPQETEVWKSICPNPNLFFKNEKLGLKTKNNKPDLISFRKKHLGKGLSLSYDEPLNMQRGSGVFLMNNKGRKYLDTVNNVAHVGHEHPRIVKAGQEQMALLNTNTRYLHENINAFAEELLNTFPKELSVVHFVNSGSEANELALRMCRVYSGEKDMIAIEVGYHGNTNGCIDISSYKFDGKAGKGAPEHTHIVPLPDAFRGMYQGKNTGVKYAKHIQDQIEKVQSKGRNIAGFICESIISCGGQIELPKNYLKLAFQAVRNAGGLCISDEVQVGCGRMGSQFWGFQLHDVIPDIVTIGKPIGNGHPLAAVVCTPEVADAFANGMEYFNTFGGNPVSCAIGREVLKVIKDEELQKNALNVGNYLKNELIKLQSRFPIIADVRGQGLFLGFELCDVNKNPLGDKASYLANRMKEMGILMSTDGQDHNVLKIKPPIVFSKENANELLFRLNTVFAEDFMKY